MTTLAFNEDTKAVLRDWKILCDLDGENFAEVLEDEAHPLWDLTANILVAGRVCQRVGLHPYGPDFEEYSGPAHYERFIGVPLPRVQAFLRKWEDIDSDAGRSAYVTNWSRKYSPIVKRLQSEKS